MLYVRESLQESTVPLVASHFHYSSFSERFSLQGTRDSVPYCIAPTAIEFFNKIGGLVRHSDTSEISLVLSTISISPPVGNLFLQHLPSVLGY